MSKTDVHGLEAAEDNRHDEPLLGIQRREDVLICSLSIRKCPITEDYTLTLLDSGF